MAAITNYPKPPGYVFTEEDFATVALDTATKDKAEGRKTAPGILYAASKTAADRAVWKFKNEHNVSPLLLPSGPKTRHTYGMLTIH